jgi:hypothetical protein
MHGRPTKSLYFWFSPRFPQLAGLKGRVGALDCKWYAEAAKYSPLGVHFHWMWSFSSSLSLMFLIRLHNLINSTSSSLEEMWRAAPIQLLFLNSLATDLDLKHASLYRFRAMSMGVEPFNHLSCQNIAFLLFPKHIIVEAKKGLCPLHHMAEPSPSMASRHRPVVPTPPLPESSFEAGKIMDT